MKLSELQTGEKAVIVRVNGHGSFRKRLIEMGFIQGKEVRVVLNAPLKDPIEYEIIGYKVSLRREEARQIEVVTEEEAREALKTDEHLQALPGDLEDKERLDRALEHIDGLYAFHIPKIHLFHESPQIGIDRGRKAPYLCARRKNKNKP